MSDHPRKLWDGTLPPDVKPGDPPKSLGFDGFGGEVISWPTPCKWVETDYTNFKPYGWKA